MKTLLLSCLLTLPLHAEIVTAKREGQQVIIHAGTKEILRYQAEAGELPRPEIPQAYRRGGYIQSIHTPAGRLVTDDFAAGHLHHHGVWASWTKTSFEGRKPDFWNMGAETGKVAFVALDEVWKKDGKAGFRARHEYVDLTAKPAKTALLESWDVVISAAEDRYLIDLTSTQTCATDSPLKLPEHHYGGLGFRGNAAWNGAANCRFLTASGLTDRQQVNTSREKWCWIGGKVGDAICGITILGHPGNFRFPQPIRAHPSEPFFCYAPQQGGEMEIAPGQKSVSRFRFVITDGEPDAKAAEAWWKAYAEER